MKYNFDKVINRKNTDCYKWDTTKDGVIPMWVADMDFEVAKPIVDSIIKRANHAVCPARFPGKSSAAPPPGHG